MFQKESFRKKGDTCDICGLWNNGSIDDNTIQAIYEIMAEIMYLFDLKILEAIYYIKYIR